MGLDCGKKKSMVGGKNRQMLGFGQALFLGGVQCHVGGGAIGGRVLLLASRVSYSHPCISNKNWRSLGAAKPYKLPMLARLGMALSFTNGTNSTRITTERDSLDDYGPEID